MYQGKVIGIHLFSLIILLLCSCIPMADPGLEDCTSDLRLLSEHALEIDQPSGLSFYKDGHLLCVSDQQSTAYVISTEGERLRVIDIKGDDSEGISYDFDGGIIYSADEDDGLLRSFDPDSEEKKKWEVIDGSRNGLEGCSIDLDNGRVFMIKEDKDGELIHFYPESGRVDRYPLDFAKDYSGVFFEASTQELWILSDESETVSRCDLQGKELVRYTLCVSQAEGIVVDLEVGRLYVVSDKTEKLYVFQLPS